MSLDTGSTPLPELIDQRPVSRFQYGVITLCALVMFIDGFDTQAISYLAPHIAKEWGLSQAVLGPIFSSALLGLMVGYLVLSPLSDRFGHKRVLVVATASFAVFTLLAVWSGNVTELVALRFLTGVGLGAAAPSAIALTGEFSPARLRATFVLVIYCGFSLGFVAAGLAVGWLLPHHGWRSLFWVGALVPLVLVPALIRYLPESPTFMIRRRYDPSRVLAVLRRVDPTLDDTWTPSAVAVEDRTTAGRAALSSLFTRHWVWGTVLLWLVFVINLGEFYALQSWLPSILTDLHYPMSTVVSATTLTTVGGIVAAFLTGPSMDRLGAYGTVACVYLAGCVFVALTGLALGSPVWLLLTATFLSGCCVSGGQKSVIALAAVFYPAAMRSSGVGWALGIGRLGGIAGPLVVGAALSAGWDPRSVFYAMAVPMLVAGLVVLVLGRRYST
ncbi:MFS transporter [Pseudonocardia spinosispora]|uniref:MFS transporter n=1 Tax=Pseudonocardia spinosispora TaxID=103441 RepID=UPI00040233A0|nr:MFS transporter [Pseudonocardia spinosispora]